MYLELAIRLRQEARGCRYSSYIKKELFEDIETLHPAMQRLVNDVLDDSSVVYDESMEPAISLYLNRGKTNIEGIAIEFEDQDRVKLLHMFHNEINLAELQGYVIRSQEAIDNDKFPADWNK